MNVDSVGVPDVVPVGRCVQCDENQLLDAGGFISAHTCYSTVGPVQCEGSGSVPAVSGAPDADGLIPAAAIRAGDEFVTPDGVAHRAKLHAFTAVDGAVGVPAVHRVSVGGVEQTVSGFVVLDDVTSVLLLAHDVEASRGIAKLGVNLAPDVATALAYWCAENGWSITEGVRQAIMRLNDAESERAIGRAVLGSKPDFVGGE